MPRLLDLFCGAGGASMGYARAGFKIIGVDIEPQPNYPFEFVQADAFSFLGGNVAPFDLIHASPPCQGYTTLQHLHNDKEYPRLIEATRTALESLGTPYVIENVEGAKQYLRNPRKLCGSSFGLRVRRHRLFECSFEVEAVPCDHAWQDKDKPFLIYEHYKWRRTGTVPVYGLGGRKAEEYWPWAMGMGETWDDCWMNRREITQAIPPAYTEYIGKVFNE